MANCSLLKDSQVRGPSPNIDQGNSHFLLFLIQNCVAGRKRFEDHLTHFQGGPLYTFVDVLSGTHKTGDNVHICFHAHSRHPERIIDPVLPINDKLLGYDMDNLPI
jgi:hypothetical protein